MIYHYRIPPLIPGSDYPKHRSRVLFFRLVKSDNLSVSIEKPITVDEFRCDECDIVFTGLQTEQRFKEHMKIEHDNKKPFKCEQCDFRSARVYGLSVHIVSKHTDEKPWACDQCDFRTKLKQSLQVHKQTIHEKAKLFKCQLCSYEAKTNHQLKDHMNTHTGARPYKCDLCDYTGKVLKKYSQDVVSW